jgi:hypothetical protein
MGLVAHVRKFAPALMAAAVLIGGSAVAAPANAAPAAPTGWPVVKLYAPQLHQKVAVFGGISFIDPSIYVESRGSALQFDVQRKSFANPLTITQIIRSGGVTQRRPLGSWALDGWNGLRRFFRLTIKDSHGKVLSSRTHTFCPNGGAQRATPDSPATSPYPFSCSYSTPFLLGGVWGIAKGWAIDPMQSGLAGLDLRLKVGQTYTATMSITKAWRGVLRMGAHNATATVKLQAVTPSQCNPCTFRSPAAQARKQSLASKLHETAARMQQVPLLASPPSSVLPDLKPLPSWGISVQNEKHANTGKVTSLLSFGATVAVLGNGPLDVEGFSTHHAAAMPAYQYYWRGTKVVGRTRAGTMGFDSRKGHNHWHFEQFAQYRLLNKSQNRVLLSHKVGFCIAPTDGVDLLIRHATLQPTFTGFFGNCGSPGALWVQEQMPLGWGDTYFQTVAGQSFDINSLPNGVYYIEIIANPERVLHETNTANDTSFRKVIIGGTRGHRTVRVPAVHGIDPE